MSQSSIIMSQPDRTPQGYPVQTTRPMLNAGQGEESYNMFKISVETRAMSPNETEERFEIFLNNLINYSETKIDMYRPQSAVCGSKIIFSPLSCCINAFINSAVDCALSLCRLTKINLCQCTLNYKDYYYRNTVTLDMKSKLIPQILNNFKDNSSEVEGFVVKFQPSYACCFGPRQANIIITAFPRHIEKCPCCSCIPFPEKYIYINTPQKIKLSKNSRKPLSKKIYYKAGSNLPNKEATTTTRISLGVAEENYEAKNYLDGYLPYCTSMILGNKVESELKAAYVHDIVISEGI